MSVMARKRTRSDVAVVPEDKQPETEIDSEPAPFFAGFESLTQDLSIMVTRKEPYGYDGFMGQIHLASDQQHRIPLILQERWGGGLYLIQLLGKQPNGRPGFSQSMKLKVGGQPRHADTPASTLQAVPESVQAPPAPQNYYQHPPPYYPPQVQQQPVQSTDIVRAIQPLLGPVMEVFKAALGQQGAQNLDVAKVVDSVAVSLKEAAKPTDELDRIERTAKLINTMRGPAPVVHANSDGGGEHWIAPFAPILAQIAERVLAPKPPQRPPRLRLPKAPPGFVFDASTYSYVPKAGQMQPNPSPPPPAQEPEDDEEDYEDDESDDDEGEDEGDDESGPIDAEDAFSQFEKMDPIEQQRLLIKVQQKYLPNASTNQNDKAAILEQ